MTNNRFIDAIWIYAGISINIEHFSFKCPIEPYTKIQFENNTVYNSKPMMSFIYLTMDFISDGIQEAVIKNNHFQNV